MVWTYFNWIYLQFSNPTMKEPLMIMMMQIKKNRAHIQYSKSTYISHKNSNECGKEFVHQCNVESAKSLSGIITKLIWIIINYNILLRNVNPQRPFSNALLTITWRRFQSISTVHKLTIPHIEQRYCANF